MRVDLRASLARPDGARPGAMRTTGLRERVSGWRSARVAGRARRAERAELLERASRELRAARPLDGQLLERGWRPR